MKSITVETLVNKDIETVWDSWTNPVHIVNWNFASDDWETTKAENDLKVGGKFLATMAAKDKSASFDFVGMYTEIEKNKKIKYSMDGDRKVEIIFEKIDGRVKITETFDMENENSEELQRSGWQAILENFKKYTEGL